MQARAEIVGNDGDHLRFNCPGCESAHVVTIAPHPHPWEWNGDLERPTLDPSVLVTGGAADIRCHSFVRDGRIEYLADCTHDLAATTVDLPLITSEG